MVDYKMILEYLTEPGTMQSLKNEGSGTNDTRTNLTNFPLTKAGKGNLQNK